MRIAVIVLVALATFAVSYAWHRNPQGGGQRERRSAEATATLTGPAVIPTTENPGAPASAGAIPATARLPEWDTTGLLQESLTVDELLEAANADSGEGFTPVDRERLAALLRADAELRKALGE